MTIIPVDWRTLSSFCKSPAQVFKEVPSISVHQTYCCLHQNVCIPNWAKLSFLPSCGLYPFLCLTLSCPSTPLNLQQIIFTFSTSFLATVPILTHSIYNLYLHMQGCLWMGYTHHAFLHIYKNISLVDTCIVMGVRVSVETPAKAERVPMDSQYALHDHSLPLPQVETCLLWI